MSGWPEAPSLLVAHAGGREGHAALGPALRALASWAERRGARLVGLWEGEPPPLVRRATDRDLILDPDLLGSDPSGPGVPDPLAGEAPWGAVVLSDPGRTALEIAHALYLAGVERRAGFAPEFGGGVLSDPVAPPPPGTPPETRHLRLLEALGLTQGQ